MPFSASRATVVAALISACLALPAAMANAQGANRDPAVTALASIVGVWQSDTTNGVSARSTCQWTPTHGGVVCEQDIITPDRPQHALNLFTRNTTDNRFALYVVMRPGDAVDAIAFSIEGSIWTYGGSKAAPNGQTYRTINDFSLPNSYTWRQESSTDGTTWTVGAHGRSRRVNETR